MNEFWNPVSRLIFRFLLIIIIGGPVVSCNITRLVPEGEYLLTKTEIDVDTRQVSKSSLESFVRQRPNDPGASLRVYNWMKGDTSRWLTKKMGQAPVIYDDKQTVQTVRNLKIEMANRGFIHANVVASTDTSDKKMKVTYRIISNEPSRIRNYEVDMQDRRIDTLLTRRKRRNRTELKEGVIFAMDKLETERSNVSQLLRNVGYFNTTEDNLHYLADTTVMPYKVDLTMIMQGTQQPKLYRIRNVNVWSGYDPFSATPFIMEDSMQYRNLHIYYDSLHFLRPSVLSRNILMKNHAVYRETSDRMTYSNINRLGCVSRTQIQYEEVARTDSSLLDCNIYLTPGNVHGIQLGLDGTNKEGDLGVAATISYNHYNLFNGAERLTVKLRGAYEFVSKSQSTSTDESSGEETSSSVFSDNYYEYGIETSLSFPQLHIPLLRQFIRDRFTASSEYSISFDVQKRPEFTRNFFNLNWKQRLDNKRNAISHVISPIDINYVMMASMSDSFRKYLDEDANALTKYSYDNIFTAGVGYNLVYSKLNMGKFKKAAYTVRFSAESSGNLLNGIFELSGAEKSADGQYTILNNPFAQYVKGDLDFAHTWQLDYKNTIATHAALGMAYPYGNSTILPFEKRYYGGGPNNVRGWNTRRLGPGSFDANLDNNPATHVGDMRFIATLEYRYKWIKYLELAAFVDAGNIWTLREYENQPGGKFEWDGFYNELALGGGIGIRIDLSFLVIRLDGGKRIYDPAQPSGNRWIPIEKFKNNSAFYLAIGYPF